MQSGAATVQGELEQALKRVTGESIRVVGAGRTDAGVHARGQVVSFYTGSALPAETMVKALNFYLPDDIAVSGGYVVADDFDARRWALSREYRYTVLNSPTRSPLGARTTWLITRPLDLAAMKEASGVLLGKRDFAPFSGPAPRGGTVRTLMKAEVSLSGDLVFFDTVADSFLPQQVRRTVGALAKVGLGKMGVEEFKSLACSGQSGATAEVAPARGLCLMKVNYPDGCLSSQER